MPNDTTFDHTNIPIAWRTPSLDIPEKYRSAVLGHAMKVREKCLQDVRFEILSSEKLIGAESTPLSTILFCAYIPYHLITDDIEHDFLQILEQEGPGDALSLLNNANPTSDVLMVVGDLPVEAHVFIHLDAYLATNPSRYFIAGPGVQIESVLRAYAQLRGIPKFFVRTLDHSGGACWDASPGDILDGAISKLFKEQRPTHVLGFDPVRLPSTQITLDTSRKLGLPVTTIEAHVLK